MPFRIWVGNANPSYNVTVYARAGAAPNNSYTIQYSPDNTNWSDVATSLTSTVCAIRGTVSISTGIIYIRALQTSNSNLINGRGSGSSTCPANAAFACTYSVSVIANRDVAYTVYVDGSGNFSICAV